MRLGGVGIVVCRGFDDETGCYCRCCHCCCLRRLGARLGSGSGSGLKICDESQGNGQQERHDGRGSELAPL